MTVEDFDAQFTRMSPGALVQYHAGLLAQDRLDDPELDRLAERLLQLATSRYALVRPYVGAGWPPKGSPRGLEAVELLQRKCGPDDYIYYVVRKIGVPYLRLVQGDRDPSHAP